MRGAGALSRTCYRRRYLDRHDGDQHRGTSGRSSHWSPKSCRQRNYPQSSGRSIHRASHLGQSSDPCPRISSGPRRRVAAQRMGRDRHRSARNCCRPSNCGLSFRTLWLSPGRCSSCTGSCRSSWIRGRVSSPTCSLCSRIGLPPHFCSPSSWSSTNRTGRCGLCHSNLHCGKEEGPCRWSLLPGPIGLCLEG